MDYATGWMTEESWFNSLRGARECCFLQSVQTGSDDHTASNLMGTRGASSVVEQPEREFDHLRPSVAYIVSEWSGTAPSPIRIRGLDRDRDIFVWNSNVHCLY